MFSKKQLEQLGQLTDYKLQPIKEDVSEIKHRLDNVEKDVKVIKSCSTIQREINVK